MIQSFLSALAGMLGRSARRPAQILASGLAGLLFALYQASPYRGFIEGNIARAGLKRPERLARAHVRLLLWAIVDLLRFVRFRDDKRLPRELLVTGMEHFEAASAAGRGVILVSAHFGCWELIPALTSLRGYATTVLVQKPSQDVFDRLFRELRAWAGVRTLNNDTLAGLRPILKALRQGETVGLVIDQHGESRRLVGKFFGHRVSLPEGPAFLARRTGAAIVPVLARWRGNQHVIEFYPVMTAIGGADGDLQTMQAIYDWLETQIRRYPENWLWSYNRWDKFPCPVCETMPAGSAGSASPVIGA